MKAVLEGGRAFPGVFPFALLACAACGARTSVDAQEYGGSAALSAAYDHTCALTTLGAVRCWGDNMYGELGDDSTAQSPVPVAVSGLGYGARAVTAGYDHSCALTAAGGVRCWGANDMGQLGDGTTTESHVPVDVVGLSSGIIAIAAGSQHSCALTESGRVVCWGYNQDNELGDGDTINSPIPVPVSGLSSGVAAISVGATHACALTTAGGALCWGSNFFAELGNGSWDQSSVPVEVSGLSSGVAAIAAGAGGIAAEDVTCALTTTGGVLCWGAKFYGTLGDMEMTASPLPVAVSGLSSGMASISAGTDHACAVTTDGRVLCWGENEQGQIGNDSTTKLYFQDALVTVPLPVLGLPSTVVAVSSGYQYTCALTDIGEVLCWGGNGRGQLGDGMGGDQRSPTKVADP